MFEDPLASQFGVDLAFAQFFRIASNDFEDDVREILDEMSQRQCTRSDVIQQLPLDRLSLLACDRQGLAPEELLMIPPEESPSACRPTSNGTLRQSKTMTSSVVKKIAEAKRQSDIVRRLGKVRLAEAERASIAATLMNMDTTNHRRQLTKEENALLIQLRNQNAAAKNLLLDQRRANAVTDDQASVTESELPQCNEVAEADACDVLLQWQSESDRVEKRHQAQLEKVQRSARAEFERVKAKQHRSVVSEVAETLQRAVVEARMESKEREHQAYLHAQEQKRQRAARESERKRIAKRRECIANFRESVRVRRHELESRFEYREERTKSAQRERELELEQRRIKRSEAESLAKQRQRSVDASFSEYRTMLGDELGAKMDLSSSNKEHLTLQSKAARELKRAHDEIRREHVEATAAQAAAEQLHRERLLATKEQDIQQRKEIVQQAIKDRARMVSNAIAEKQSHSQLMCEQMLKDRETKRRELEMEYESKNERIKQVEQQKELDRLVHAELAAQRIQHHEENRLRVIQAEKYQHELKAALLAREEQQARQRRAAEKEHRRNMAELMVSLDKEKEMLLKSLEVTRGKVDPSCIVPETGGGDLQRHGSFKPSKEMILRHAEQIATAQLERITNNAVRPASATHVPKQRSPVAPADIQNEFGAAGTAGDDDRATSATGCSVPGASPSRKIMRPLSAVGRRTPHMDIVQITTTVHREEPLRLSADVAKQLVEVDELGDFALAEEERRRCGVPRRTNATPVADMVQRMTALYYNGK